MKICIVGAGLAGSLIAVLLNKLGFDIYVFEKRNNEKHYNPNHNSSSDVSEVFGTSTSATKRSINLALSYRGIIALKEAGVFDEILQHAIPMPQRVIHLEDGKTIFQPYGKSGDTLWSVSRQTINKVLLDLVQEPSNNIKTYFGYTLLSANKSGYCTFQSSNGRRIEQPFDLVIGADGAYSAVRESILKQGRINFSREYISHGYKELSIPPLPFNFNTSNGISHYALPDHKGLHIWPRGKFMLIALPNPDKSFTATLFAPHHGTDGFDSIDPQNPENTKTYFHKYFPDVVPLMPELVHDFRSNPVGSLVTIRTNPWNLGKVVLLGDAAHAVVPFYGQGMNAGFEDGFILYNIIREKLEQQKSLNQPSFDFIPSIEQFSASRISSVNGLSDLCLEHYYDMASNTASMFYHLRRKLESYLSILFPNSFIPLYSMVAFSNIPYDVAIKKAEAQDKLLNSILITMVVIFLSIALLLLWQTRKIWPSHKKLSIH